MSFQNNYTDEQLMKQIENYEKYDPLLRLIPKQESESDEFDIEKASSIRKALIAEMKAEREKEQGNKNILKQDTEVV